MEIGGLAWIAGPKSEIRFVPDFEVPLGDFVDSIAVDQMSGEGGNQRGPAVVILGRRNDWPVKETLAKIGGGQFGGHETELDKRTYVILEQSVVNLIDVGKIVDGLALGIFVVDPDFVIENGVESNVFEVGGRFHLAEIVLIAFAQAENGAAGAEHLFPKVREAMRRSVDVDLESFRRGGVLRRGSNGMQKNCGGQDQPRIVSKIFHGVLRFFQSPIL